MTSLPDEAEVVKRLTNLPIGDLMRQAHRRLVSYLDAALTEAGRTDVRAPHVSVLATVDTSGSRLATLVQRGGRTKQATAELAGHLVKNGYLRVRPDPSDGRAKLYVPTEAGLDLLSACTRIVHDYEQWLDGVLTRDTVAQLRQALVKIIEATPAS